MANGHWIGCPTLFFGCEPTKQALGYPLVIKHGKLGGWAFPFSMEISVFRFIVQKKKSSSSIIINQYYSSINNYKWFIFFACCFSDQGVEKFQLNSQVWARQDHHLKEGRGICLARSLSVFFWMLVPLVNCWWNTTGRWMLAGKCNEHGKCTWTFHERSRSTLLKHNKQLASLWIPGLDRVLVSLI